MNCEQCGRAMEAIENGWRCWPCFDQAHLMADNWFASIRSKHGSFMRFWPRPVYQAAKVIQRLLGVAL